MTTLTREQKTHRAALIEQCYHRNPGRGYPAAIQEGARQFREYQATGRITGSRQAAGQKAITEAVAQVVRTATAARKAQRKTAKREARRATAEAAAVRALQQRAQTAARFSETAVSTSLHEASSNDLAAVAAIAMSSTGQPAPAARTVIEMTVDPQGLSLEDLGLTTMIGMTGSSPFFGGSPAGASPFWRDLQAGGASKGTADA